ncbi:MAG: MoaD/ThiS family protein [Alphaproteobacteria bacterium]
MKITLKLYASLMQYLPDGAVLGEVDIDIDNNSSIEAILSNHGVPPEHCHLVLHNGHYISPSERHEKILGEGDALAVWPPVAGG